MNRILMIILIISLSIIFVHCDDQGDNIVGSRDHDIKSNILTEPAILANGISETEISATVYNNKGEIAPGMKVAFTTTAGAIDEFAISDYYGKYRDKC